MIRPHRWLLMALALAMLGCESATRVTIEQVNEELRLLEPQEQLDFLRKKTSVDRVGDAARLQGTEPVVLTWFSLVGGLDGTGTAEVPDLPGGALGPDTDLRNELLKSLYRSDVPGFPAQILSSLDTAPVTVSAIVPPLVQVNQRVDVVVQALGRTRSLRGGVLMSTPLRQTVTGRGGQTLYGETWAYAEGKVTPSHGRLAFGERAPTRETIGYAPAGGTSTVTGYLALALRRADIYGVALITLSINEQFPDAARVLGARSIRISVPQYYRSQWERFAQVIAEIRCRPPRGRALRTHINNLAGDLKGDDPVLARQAAFELEALAPESVPALEGALRSPHQEVRLLAARTLAAMREPAGITPLMHTIELGSETNRRLAAHYLNFYSQHNVRDFQKKLLADSDPEVRYRALLGLEQTQEDAPYTTHQDARGEDFKITRVRTAGPAVLVVKARNPRRFVFFGPELTLRPPFKQEHMKEILVEAQDTSQLFIRYRIYGQSNTLPVRSMAVIELVRALDHINLTSNDIMDLIFKLSRADAIAGEVLFLDE